MYVLEFASSIYDVEHKRYWLTWVVTQFYRGNLFYYLYQVCKAALIVSTLPFGLSDNWIYWAFNAHELIWLSALINSKPMACCHESSLSEHLINFLAWIRNCVVNLFGKFILLESLVLKLVYPLTTVILITFNIAYEQSIRQLIRVVHKELMKDSSKYSHK